MSTRKGGRASPSRGAHAPNRPHVDPVVDAVDRGREPVPDFGQVAAVVLGAGHHEAGQRDLLAQLLPVRRVDVLGVRRKAVRQPAQDRGVERDRGGRVGEVRVQVHHPRPRQAAVDEVGRLEQVAQRREVARAAVAPQGQRQAGRGRPRAADRQAGAVEEQPVRVAQEGFGQVVDPGADVADARVRHALAPGAHGEDVNREPQVFEQQDLVGDERLRDARIALQHHPEHGPAGQHRPHRNSFRRWRMASMPVRGKRAMASRRGCGSAMMASTLSRIRSGVRASQGM